MKYVISAVRPIAPELPAFNIMLDVFENNGADIVELCKEAAREYVSNCSEGLERFHENVEFFNWADFFDYVPNEICEKYGFRKIENDVCSYVVDMSTTIVDEPCFYVNNIQWDTDNEKIDNLPEGYYVPYEDLLYDNEEYHNVNIEELKDRTINYLTNKFGFCIFSCNIQ